MPNPAELLFNQFTEWNQPDKSVHSARMDGKPLSFHRRAVQNLNDVRHLLNEMQNAGKRVNSHLDMFPTWAQVIFQPEVPWGAHRTGGIDKHCLQILETLIDPMDEFVNKMEPESFDKLLDYLVEIETALDEDEALSKEIKHSTKTLLNHLRNSIKEFNQVGEWRTDKLIKQLFGELAFVMIQSQKKEVWFDVLNNFVFPYVVNQVPGIEATGFLTAINPGSGN